ncbi:DUF4112 domain-containing protein [Natronoarchaeum mannanilyticum]|uniref:DUF4112 domain-containing protein n=1 Tax=Natronoarchaeum mannanilyticum TaxID=926360 RepID=A0AAV3T6P7_9EURY
MSHRETVEEVEAELEEAIVGGTEGALKRIDAVGTLLDDAFRVPGTDIRFGLDPVVGVLPIAGDWATAVVSTYIVAEAVNLGVPKGVIGRMLFNIGLDATVGMVPILGTLFDTAWKANRRNVELVEKHVDADA